MSDWKMIMMMMMMVMMLMLMLLLMMVVVMAVMTTQMWTHWKQTLRLVKDHYRQQQHQQWRRQQRQRQRGVVVSQHCQGHLNKKEDPDPDPVQDTATDTDTSTATDTDTDSKPKRLSSTPRRWLCCIPCMQGKSRKSKCHLYQLIACKFWKITCIP